MRRGAFLITMLVLLVGCERTQDRAPFTDSRIPANLAPQFWPPEGWTWGLIQIGDDPPQRYGVAAPASVPRAQLLILPGYGEAAEDYFDDANAFIAQGYGVWMLDGAGQGGSGRSASPRDLGHVADFESDKRAIERMLNSVVPAKPDQPVVVIANTTAAPVALRTLQSGRARAAALVLAQTTLEPPETTTSALRDPLIAQWAKQLRISAFRPPGDPGWNRAEPSGPPDSPARVRYAWALSNPDLRMGTPSLGWLAAFDDLTADMRAANPRSLKTPVLMLDMLHEPASRRQKNSRLCAALRHCLLQPLKDIADLRAHETAFLERVVARAQRDAR